MCHETQYATQQTFPSRLKCQHVPLKEAACHMRQYGDMIKDAIAQVDDLFDEVVRAREAVSNMTLRDDCHDFEVPERLSCGMI